MTEEWADSPVMANFRSHAEQVKKTYWERYENRHAEPDARPWAASLTAEDRRALIAATADQDEFTEDPRAAFEEKLRLEALRQEKELLTMMGEASLQDLPSAVRALYRQNPNNASIRALYEATMREIHERAEDKLRGALLPAVDKMIDLMDCGDEKTELRAATYVFERLAGKTPDVIEHRQDAPFQVMLERVVSGPRIVAERLALASAVDTPIEGEIVAERISAPKTGVELVSEVRRLGDDGWDEEMALMRGLKLGS